MGAGGGTGGADPQDSGGYRWMERGIEKQRDEETERWRDEDVLTLFSRP